MKTLLKSHNLLALCALLSSLALSCGGGGGGGEYSSTPTTSPTTTTSPTPTQSVEGETTRTLKTNILGRVLTETTLNVNPTVKLTVDLNKDGNFDSSDKSYQTVAKEGKFQILGIEIPEDGAKASLTVKADGYTTYSKVVKLQPNVPVNLTVSLAPASTVVVNVPKKRAPGEKVIFTLKDGKIEVSRNLRALSTEGAQISLILDESSIPQEVTKLKVSMKSFNSANPKDIKYFPGEFKGEAPEGDKEVGLKSVSFAFIGIEDQDGNPITLKATKASTCLYQISQILPTDAIKTIREVGDFSKEKVGCQVPIYSYNGNSEKWEFLGTGTIVDVNDCKELQDGKEYKVNICITKPNWGDYVNLDYPIYYEEVKEVNFCFILKDANNNPIPNTWFELSTEGYYDSDYTDEKGIARIELLSTGQSCEELLNKFKNQFFYLSPTTGTWLTVQPAQLQSVSVEGCTCAYEVKESTFLTEVKVVANTHDGKPISNAEVCLADENYIYYQCSTTNENGEATFFAIPSRTYEAFGPNLTEVRKEVLPSIPNIFVLTSDNNLPEVYLELPSQKVIQGEKATINLYAYDPDGDSLQLKSLTCNDKEAQIVSSTSEDSYMEITASCSANEIGEVRVKAIISDGKEEKTVSESFEVVKETNHPPVVYGVAVVDSENNSVMPDKLKTSTLYKVLVFAYDPDGDELNYSVNNENCTVDSGEISCSFNQPGIYTANIVITDGKNQVEVPVELKVIGTKLPPEILAIYFDKYIASPNDSIEIYLYAEDTDSQTLSAKAYVENQPQTLTCNSLEEGYFECSGKITLPQETIVDYLNIRVEVSDEDNNTSIAEETILINKGNLAPLFTLPLPERLELNAGDSYTFKVEAQDPEGKTVSYTWFINGEKVAENVSQFTYTFKEPGLYQVRVEASDGEKISSSQSNVVVAQKGNLIFRYNVEGVYVSLLDDNFNIVKTVKSNEEGIADLGTINKATVNVSVAITPDTIVNSDMVFKDAIYWILWNSYDPKEVKDIAIWYKEGKVPTDVASSLLYDEEMANADSNKDGYLDKDELYTYYLSKKDFDGDGRLTLKETGYDTFNVVVLKDIPVGEYTRNLIDEIIFNFDIHPYMYEHDYEDILKRDLKYVEIRVKNVPSDVNIDLVDSFKSMIQTNDNETFITALLPLQDNGKYSAVLASETDGNRLVYVIKDETSDKLVINYADFSKPKVIKVLNPLSPDDNFEFISLNENYEGLEYYIGYWVNTHGDELQTVALSGSDISLFYEKSADIGKGESYGWVSWGLETTLTELPSSIDLNTLRNNLLLVEATLEEDNDKVKLSGIDLSEVDEIITGFNVSTDKLTVLFRIRTPQSCTELPLIDLEKVVPKEPFNTYIAPIEDSQATTSFFVNALDAQGYNWKCSYNRSCDLGNIRFYSLYLHE